jgi:checkpoint serine/threonine-protein kinase
MTINTRAATDDILDIFNQPLRNVGPLGSHAESDGESDFDDDDYTSAGDSTATGRISVPTSEFGDEDISVRSVAVPDISDPKSVSEWSEFTSSKHVPKVPEDEVTGDITNTTGPDGLTEEDFNDNVQDIITPVSPKADPYTKYIPVPPGDYEPPTHPYRDPLQVSQNRLPFMTPIVEKTESSIGLPTGRPEKDYFSAKTPSRRRGDATPVITEGHDELMSSPFQEIVNEAKVEKARKPSTKKLTSTKPDSISTTSKGPIIKDAQCNPVHDSIRNTILENIQPPLSSLPGFHDYGTEKCNKGPEIRKFIKALTKAKTCADKTLTISTSPTLQFLSNPSTTYLIKRELGKGAYAPVYLAEESPSSSEITASTDDDPTPSLIAIKSELPPSPWEFYIMTTALTRLSSHRAATSILSPHSFHLFADEGYLLEAYHAQGTLLDIVNIAKSTPASTNPALALDEVIAMFFAVELLRTLEAVHGVGLLHGDLKADNCLVRLAPVVDGEWDAQYDPSGEGGWSEKGICLIDWGRGIDMRAFKPEVGFIADWKTGKGDCVEMREMRPWTYQIDYWGAAGIIHVLLFGKWIEDVAEKAIVPSENSVIGLGVDGSGLGEGVVGAAAAQGKKYRLKEGLKRYWATDIWGAVFDTLMNPSHWAAGEEGGKMPLQRRLGGIRKEMEEWLVENGERRGLKMGWRKWEERIREKKR